MLNSVDFSGRPFHFIGVGGIGMSALAYVLTKRQLPVFGSDLCLNHITQRLQDNGVHIFWSQDAANFQTFLSSAEPIAAGPAGQSATPAQLPQVICSTAVNTANPEYKAAVELGCPIFHRSDVLAALISEAQGIAVAGTHGKTTTSSMIGYMLWQAGLDPTVVVGGEVNAWEGNARVGAGPHLVAEADESDGSLVKFAPQIGVITNIELDHPDHYATLDQVIQTFQTFANQCQTIVGCLDNAEVAQLLARQQPQQQILSYGLQVDSAADYTASQIDYGAHGTRALIWERGVLLGRLELKLLGQHNLSNALAAVAVGRLLGLEFSQIAAGLIDFEGARRRFELRGEANQISFIDDYAHHPSEVQVTLAAARLRVEDAATHYRRVVAVFQPHRYSRTLTFLDSFARAFSDADLVITTDIYSAGEANLGQVTGQQLADAIAAHHSQVAYQPTLQSLSAYLMETLEPGDLVLFLGAGNLNRIIPDLVTFYQQLEQRQAYCGST
ncbi:MAG: UDP-N-acetylmuramate--L-alanine ligase [Elainella sp.]